MIQKISNDQLKVMRDIHLRRQLWMAEGATLMFADISRNTQAPVALLDGTLESPSNRHRRR